MPVKKSTKRSVRSVEAVSRLSKNRVEETINTVAGQEALPIVKYLKGKKNVSEFIIAQKTKLEVNRVRNMLYKLQNFNLVSYFRKKDRQKGWYISYWTFNPSGIRHLIGRLKTQKLQELKERLAQEEANQGNYFLCPNVCIRMDFSTATEQSFRCPECGNMVNQHDNLKTIERLRQQISQIEAVA